ncbi:MAG: NifB/NifX family molybdenum-iron cluster-binding protein [Candidatus Odinarchaeota archaeon]
MNYYSYSATDEDRIIIRIAISALSPDLNGDIDPRFGRCAQFLLFDLNLNQDIDISALHPKLLPNAAINAPGGAGIQAAQMIIDEEIQVIITGNLGPNAARVLGSGSIKTYSASGKIVDALIAFQQKKLPELTGASVPGHFGMGMGRGGGGRR